ncbi:hypothetical protein [Streptomyces sp. N50]|uniref:hypothetical protein n=1 Tax=Streptomyces sp. N50 TaxID=3081765 RepID=UPI0029621083|nr:hypothetical protein [Streptomyces sp. N50]WOX15991.1 hypothetical protein R2B38_44810 [Streptomyces sp. N50]
MVKLARTHPERIAEVDEVRPLQGRIVLRLSLVGIVADKATLILQARDGGQAEMRLPADGYGGRFQVRIPLDALATACTARDWIWDLYLDAGTEGEPLRLGRHPDGISGEKNVFLCPAQRAAGVRVQLYCTVSDNVSIACAREEER